MAIAATSDTVFIKRVCKLTVLRKYGLRKKLLSRLLFLVGKSRTASSTKAFRDRLAVGRRADVAKLAPLDLRPLQDGGTPALFDSRTRLTLEEPLKLNWNVVVMWK